MSKNKGKTSEELLQEALVSVEEQPYPIPDNWVWVKLGALGEIGSSKRILQTSWQSDGIPFYRAREIVRLNKSQPIKDGIFISEDLYEELQTKNGVPQENDLLITGVGTVGETYIVKNNDKFYFKDASVLWFKNKWNLNIKFINYFMKSSFAKNQILKMSSGTTVDTYTISNANKTIITFPPLNEQKRIVDKVERLLNNINQAKQLIEEAKETFELRRAAILDKAFRGELTSKWRLENIESVSGETTINYSEYEGVLNNIPDTWCWSKLKDFEGEEQLVLTGPFGTTLSNKDFVESGIPVLTIGCLQDEGINLNKANYVTEDKANTLSRYRVKEGDILFSRMATVGRASRVGKSFEDCLINYHLMRVRLPRDINVDYFLLVVKGAPSTKLFLKSMNHGMTRDGINTKELLNLPIPFPPIEEQKRIVEFFSSLQEKEEQINQKIDFVESVLSQLQASILSTAFRGELGTNFEVEESSIEELKQLIKM